jgi:protein SCO1/2
MKFKSKELIELSSFTAQDPECKIADFIDKIKHKKRNQLVLLELLREDHRIYQERSSNTVVKLRGYALAAMYVCGTPAGALPYVYAILETERTPYLVAAAARALRGTAPVAALVRLFIKSIDNIRLRDDAMSFSKYQPEWPIENYTTALQEIFYTIQYYGFVASPIKKDLQFLLDQRSYEFNQEILTALSSTVDCLSKVNEKPLDCCDEVLENKITDAPVIFFNRRKACAEIIIEDQGGYKQSLTDLLKNKVTVLAFFYTRCDNPLKCSMSISRLAHLSAELKGTDLEDKVNIVGITYDATFDAPKELETYGLKRGFEFSAYMKLLRVVKGYDTLKKMLSLGVSYIGSVVNAHKNELYILNAEGKVLRSFTHQRWEVTEVREALKGHFNHLSAEHNTYRLLRPVKNLSKTFYTVLFPLLFALFPKCPLCWAAYLTSFGLSGLTFIPYSPWLYPIIALAIAVNLYVMFKRAYKRKSYLPCIFSTAGLMLVMIFGGLLKIQPALYAGIFLILSGSLLNSFPVSYTFFLKRSIVEE